MHTLAFHTATPANPSTSSTSIRWSRAHVAILGLVIALLSVVMLQLLPGAPRTGWAPTPGQQSTTGPRSSLDALMAQQQR